jgi:hypothetical protein
LDHSEWARVRALEESRANVEHLPFTVRIVDNAEDLGKAVNVRHSAYARHVPEVAARLTAPETFDQNAGSVVLLAESKLDGSPLGTMRIHTNRFAALPLEGSVDLPHWLQRSRSEANRLAIVEGRVGRVVKLLLFKAYYQYCLENQIDWMVIVARKPLDRQYEALLFTDVLEGAFVPMKHVGNIPHRVLAFDVQAAYAQWEAARHPLFHFMTRTYHPDIQVGPAPGLGHPAELTFKRAIRHAAERDLSRRVTPAMSAPVCASPA